MDKKFAVVSRDDLIRASAAAKENPRKRMNLNYHDLEDYVQRMMNAIEPGSYVRPHRHQSPPKAETFLILRGSVTVIVFDGEGKITDAVIIEDGRDNLGMDIKPGTWHSLFSNRSGSAVFEVKNGPYRPSTDKDFAPWAPDEKDPAAGDYFRRMVEKALEVAGKQG